MTDIKAADLPEGSVVFADGQRWTARAGRASDGLRWCRGDGWGKGNDRYMEMLFANSWTGTLASGPAAVLRHGYGDEGQG